MQGREILALAGLRVDGRRHNQVRHVKCRLGVAPDADGSVYLEQGLTKVIAVVYGPHEPSRRVDQQGEKATISCTFYNAAFAGIERRKRRQGDRRAQEIEAAVQQTLEAAVMMELYPRAQIDVHLQLIEADGSVLCSCINAAALAVAHAGISMQDMVVSCSAGYINNQAVADLNHVEQQSGIAYMPVAVLGRTEKVIMAQMDCRLSIDNVEDVLKCAVSACRTIQETFETALRQDVTDNLAARRGGATISTER